MKLRKIRFTDISQIANHNIKIGKWYKVYHQQFNDLGYIFDENENDIYFNVIKLRSKKSKVFKMEWF
jgi:hypothetical protein